MSHNILARNAIIRHLFLVCLVNLLMLSSSFVRCEIVTLDEMTIKVEGPILRRMVAMYAPEDAPTAFSAGDGTSSTISLDLTFIASNDRGVLKGDSNNPPTGQSAPFVEVVVLAATDTQEIGYIKDGKPTYCCTKRLKEESVDGCHEENQLIITAPSTRYTSRAIPFNGKNVTHLGGPEGVFQVTVTSEHYLIIGFCDENVGKYVSFSGQGEWKNPFGWLPGRLYGFLPFYGYMLVTYAALSLFWFILYWRHRTEIAPVQQIISSVLVLCLCEMAAWFGDYSSFNSQGRRHPGIVTLAMLLTVTRMTLSRVLVVAVSLGYGVTRPALGSNKARIIVLGVLYWILEFSYEMVIRHAQTNDVPEKWRVALAFPLALLNAIFYWWIFVALQYTHQELSISGQTHKLIIYKQFAVVLVLSLIAAAIFAFYQLYFMSTHQFALHWSYLWLLDGGYSVFLYTIILIMIMFMWRPTSDSRRYAYSELPVNQNDDDDEFGSLELGNFEDVEPDDHQHTQGPDMPSDDDEDEQTQNMHAATASAAKFTVDQD